MSDWELVEENNVPEDNSSEWELVAPAKAKGNKENLGLSMIRAPFRLGEDITRGLWEGFNKLPQYAQASQTEVPGVINAITKHPLHAAGQGLAGLAELGHGLMNTPKNIAEYSANRLNLLPESIANMIPQQQDISQDINQLLGEPQYPGEKLIRGAGRNALNVLGAAKLASTLNPINLTAKNIAKNVLTAQKENKENYSNLYKNLWEEAKNKGYEYNPHIAPIRAKDLQAIHKYASDKAISNLNDFLKNPTNEAAHLAKSDLLRMQRTLNKKTSLLSGEKKQLNAAKRLADTITNNMLKNKNAFTDTDLLNKYQNIQKGYATKVIPYNNAAIGKYKRNEITPKELVEALSKGEFKQKMGSKHPALAIRPKVLPVVATASTMKLAKYIYDTMMGNPAAQE